MNIVLIGFMGTGKTTVGNLLAGHLGYEFIDTDLLIEEKQGEKVAQIFEMKGECFFRQLEAQLAMELATTDHKVIATGGGFVLNRHNIDRLRTNGLIVSLTATPEEIYERVKHDHKRPLLMVENPQIQIEKLLNERSEYYRNADLILETSGKAPLQLVVEIETEFMRRGNADGRSQTESSRA